MKIVIQKSCGQKDFDILKLWSGMYMYFRWRITSHTVGGLPENEQLEEVENAGEVRV